MPIFRLVMIYVVVILAVVGFLNRDKLLGNRDQASSAQTIHQAAVSDDGAAQVAPPKAVMSEPDTSLDTEQTQTAPAMPDTSQTSSQDLTQDQFQAPSQGAAETQPTPPEKPAGAVFQDRLISARQAYWNGDIQGAEGLYKALAADYPDLADAQGELGNLYFSQRRMAEAAQAYYTAGKLSVAAGNLAQVQAMVNVLQGLAPDKAQDLRRLASNP